MGTRGSRGGRDGSVRLGLCENAGRFGLLVLVNSLVLADLLGFRAAIGTVALLTALSGGAAFRLLPPRRARRPRT